MTQDKDYGRRTEESSVALVGGETVAAFEAARESFERFCLTAGIATMQALLADEASAICGERHVRDAARRTYRWGTAASTKPSTVSVGRSLRLWTATSTC